MRARWPCLLATGGRGSLAGITCRGSGRSADGAGAIARGPGAPGKAASPPASRSALDARITSVLCVPIVRDGRALAAVYLDRRSDAPPFGEHDEQAARTFAAMLSLSVNLLARIDRAEEERETARRGEREAREALLSVADAWRFGGIETASACFAECLRLAEKVATYDADVLLTGETGAGKEQLARCIHAESARRAGPFVPVNCAALPDTLVESELFGFERGAFTGADRRRSGQVEAAEGGTLFLDEIGDLPVAVQPKLLRVLEDKRVRRLGADEERQVDVRVMAATNRDLAKDVKAGTFREDLYYRLNVVPIAIPPLRDRAEDVPSLARTFLSQSCAQLGRKGLSGFDRDALAELARRRWPGNVRELKNLVKRLCVLAAGPTITRADVDGAPGERAAEPAPAARASAARTGTLRALTAEFEK
ncbi:MAG: sigma-54-dependent Fis family transcriptional regulator, partial [Acidobacteriota bacterium]